MKYGNKVIFKTTPKCSLTEMAQWVDQELYLQDTSQEVLVEYLYRLIYFNFKTHNTFTNEETYDDFCLYCVSKVLTRLNNSKEEKVRSIVNYLKNVNTVWYNEYVRCFCSGSVDLEVADFNVVDFGDYLVDSASLYDNCAYNFNCFRVSDVVKHHLKHIPRKKRDPEWFNIYLSCLLTLNDRIRCACDLFSKNLLHEDPILLSRVIRGMKTKPPVLFHVDESMSNYIITLVNEVVHAISAELTTSTGFKITAESCLRGLVAAALNEEEDD